MKKCVSLIYHLGCFQLQVKKKDKWHKQVNNNVFILSLKAKSRNRRVSKLVNSKVQWCHWGTSIHPSFYSVIYINLVWSFRLAPLMITDGSFIVGNNIQRQKMKLLNLYSFLGVRKTFPDPHQQISLDISLAKIVSHACA